MNSRRVALVTMLVLAVMWAGHALADSPVSLADYRRTVAGTLSLVEQAIAEKDFDARAPLLNRAADMLGGVQNVQLDGGEQVPVHNEQLAAQMRAQAVAGTASSDRLSALRPRLQALLAALNMAPAAASADEDAKLHDLLARPPFAQEVQIPSELERLIDEWLSRLFGATARGIFSARDLIVVLGMLLIVVVLAFFLINLRRNAVGEAALPQESPAADAPTSAAALDRAQNLAGAGDYRAAVRQLYLSTLLWLDEHGQLRYDRSLTNREYLRVVAHAPVLRDALQPIVEAFDRVWYGFAPVSAGDFEQYRARVEAIRSL